MRITGTHIYGMLRCPHAVVLDLTEDRSKRRPITPVEEFVRKRGRDWEDEFVAGLVDYVEPHYERGDFAAGAAQTEALLREGVVGVSQGVLCRARDEGTGFLGIPDLLRREPGSSDLGDFHYVVGDIKSSGRPRSDQVLQVAFYSRLLAALQGREPGYGYLILKDGHEERFVLAEFAAAIEEVEARVIALGTDPAASHPFHSAACGTCHWSELCVPAMAAAADLSLVQGMTRGLRTTLQRIGVADATALCALAVEPAARRSHLEPTLLRRLKKAAQAHASGRPLRQRQVGAPAPDAVAVVHHLYDPFTERMLFFGVQFPATPGGVFATVCPQRRQDERDAFLSLIEQVPEWMPLWHYGEALPRWFADSRPPEHRAGVESRFVDLARRLRGAAIYPGPVFGLAQHVAYALGRDPHRAGDGNGAAMHAEGEDGAAWLEAKGRSDLADLAALLGFLRTDAEADGVAGADTDTDTDADTDTDTDGVGVAVTEGACEEGVD